jgi:hypothetical protein
MHTTVSDGTDTPSQLLSNVRKAGIGLFAVTDHDAFKGCAVIRGLLTDRDPGFLTGVEFSCRDEEGKYHILGYGFDPDAKTIIQTVEKGHRYRISKVRARLDFLETRFGFRFPEEEIKRLFESDNPGKPHIGNLMVKYGYAQTKEEAIREYVNQFRSPSEYVRPEEAISGILGAGGVPVLAHPSYGSGDELIIGEEMDRRLCRLISYGLRGVEAYYSGFSAKLREEILSFAEKYKLYVTAGSDYHGTNKQIPLGDTGLPDPENYDERLISFLEIIEDKLTSRG